METHIRNYQNSRIHLIGIGGSSMSGLAQMLVQESYQVSGSDSVDSHSLQRLKEMGVDVKAGHHPAMVAGAGLVVYSAAISSEAPERLAAECLRIPQMERAVLLGQLMEGYNHRICISGTHGKTTTGAMVGYTLMKMNHDPTIHIGGRLDSIGGSTRLGGKEYFIAEACEFNRSFLRMAPTLALLLNVEADHLDTYGDMEHVEQAFSDFLNLLPEDGVVVVNAEDERAMKVAQSQSCKVVSFGKDKGDWTYKITELAGDGAPTFLVYHHGQKKGVVKLKVAGEFNILHALATIATVNILKLNVQEACQAISSFTAPHRRFEHTGDVQGMKMYHDYGHNPAEMASAIEVALLQKRRLIAVMQPHTYSRVISLFDDYLTCTQKADITLVTDIYAAREKDPGTINSQMLVDGMRRHGVKAILTPGFDDVEDWLLTNGREGDLVLTMGCGNINLLNEQMQRNANAKLMEDQ
ncbi:MAG TPA: UDP-N-acetylmuramate--L-alanine ligase [Clostridiales bacterium]|nr:UDP-N-acetylmuramate--L-alanine ligase [Clostridiales bacterium]